MCLSLDLLGRSGLRGAAEVEQIDNFGYGFYVCRDRLLSAGSRHQLGSSLLKSGRSRAQVERRARRRLALALSIPGIQTECRSPLDYLRPFVMRVADLRDLRYRLCRRSPRVHR